MAKKNNIQGVPRGTFVICEKLATHID
jgi:hypothetical protein